MHACAVQAGVHACACAPMCAPRPLPQQRTHLRQKLQHILALIALQLDHLTQLGVIHDGAVAAELCARKRGERAGLWRFRPNASQAQAKAGPSHAAYLS